MLGAAVTRPPPPVRVALPPPSGQPESEVADMFNAVRIEYRMDLGPICTVNGGVSLEI